MLSEVEHIDDEADGAGINFVKIDDKSLVKEHGVFALPAILFFKGGSKEPVIYAGDLYDEQAILQWLLTQKDPTGDVIELFEGTELMNMIQNEEALAIYFCKFFFYLIIHFNIMVYVVYYLAIQAKLLTNDINTNNS